MAYGDAIAPIIAPVIAPAPSPALKQVLVRYHASTKPENSMEE